MIKLYIFLLVNKMSKSDVEWERKNDWTGSARTVHWPWVWIKYSKNFYVSLWTVSTNLDNFKGKMQRSLTKVTEFYRCISSLEAKVNGDTAKFDQLCISVVHVKNIRYIK